MKRPTFRLRVIIIFAILAAVAAGSYWLLRQWSTLDREAAAILASIRVSQAVVEPLESVKVDQETDVHEQILGADVTGKCHTTGKVKITLTPNPKQAAFQLSLVGQAVADTVGSHGPAQIGCHSVTKFTADKMVLFDGYTFTTNPATVTANTDLTVNNISSTLPGLRGRIVDRIADADVRREYQQARQITAEQVINQVSHSFDETVQKHLDKVNRKLKLQQLLNAQIENRDRLHLQLKTTKECLLVSFLTSPDAAERLPDFRTRPDSAVRVGLNVLALAKNLETTVNAVRLLYKEKQQVEHEDLGKGAKAKPAGKDVEKLESITVGTEDGWILIHVDVEQ